MKQLYQSKTFGTPRLAEIHQMNSIITEYQRAGYVLTVRQLYYQLVARDLVENTIQSYKRVANLINDAKLAGLIDWDMLEDRTRGFTAKTRWDSPSSIIRAAADGYHEDFWTNQPVRAFIVIEKEALTGILEKTCRRYDVPLLAARGYPSGSTLREFAVEQIIPAADEGQRIRILHLGDHDPSGLDMTRDLCSRLHMFSELEPDDTWSLEVKRIALNMDQIEEQQPPENPAKSTDSRYKEYAKQFGQSSWELDALSPQFLNDLVESEINDAIYDPDIFESRKNDVLDKIGKLQDVAAEFEDQERG